MKNEFYEILDYYVPVVRCELNYTTDYELLIATVLSAQCTDARVNAVTSVLFKNYNLKDLSVLDLSTIESIIRSVGSFRKKAKYISVIANRLLHDFDGRVPNDREYLENLPGGGRKTANVFLKNIYNVPSIPVDTHVKRVSKRLGFALEKDDPYKIEKKLMKLIPIEKWNRVSEQILLFGRYHCKSQKPLCDECLFNKECKYYNKK